MASSEKKEKKPTTPIGERLRGLRAKEKLSVRAFATKHGFTYSLWSDYERGLRRPNPDTIKKLCRIFHLSSDWLLFGDDPAGYLHTPSPMEATNDGETIVRFLAEEATKHEKVQARRTSPRPLDSLSPRKPGRDKPKRR